ncbi:hypothetical protein Ancab_033303 [Ancistrocladus abbreviatus]
MTSKFTLFVKTSSGKTKVQIVSKEILDYQSYVCSDYDYELQSLRWDNVMKSTEIAFREVEIAQVKGQARNPHKFMVGLGRRKESMQGQNKSLGEGSTVERKQRLSYANMVMEEMGGVFTWSVRGSQLAVQAVKGAWGFGSNSASRILATIDGDDSGSFEGGLYRDDVRELRMPRGTEKACEEQACDKVSSRKFEEQIQEIGAICEE